jgi:septum formation protein
MQALVLASESQYRRALLERLSVPFSTQSPNVDESAMAGENPAALAQRLAAAKANSVKHLLHEQHGDSTPIVIASDQVAALGNTQLHKPGTRELATSQLQAMSGLNVSFYTALHMIDGDTGATFCTLDNTVARLRSLSDEEIERYIEHDKPLDCAGSFKVESLGISLFDSVTTDDPTALVGLPMIAVARGLRRFGVSVP